jgi:hypothetical protein
MLSPQLQPKQCAMCVKQFLPRNSMHRVCSQRCATKLVKAGKVAEKAKLKERKAALQRIPDLIKIAQREFNAAIRQRDHGKPCISCGNPLGQGGVGGGYDCGHFRSTGSASHLRFDERNVAGQCKHCNRYLAGNVVNFRAGLIARIGAAQVEALENDNTPHKWTRDELIAIAATYRAKTKELQKEAACT